jgi:hypothetical protein
MQAKVMYEIDKGGAIKEGRTEWGKYTFEFSPSDLPEDVREEAAELAVGLDEAFRQGGTDKEITSFSHCLLNQSTRYDYEPCYREQLPTILDPIDFGKFVELLRLRIVIKKTHKAKMQEKAQKQKQEEEEREQKSRKERIERARFEITQRKRDLRTFDRFFCIWKWVYAGQ